MADLATTADLEAFLGLDPNELDGDESALLALGAASQEIRSYARVNFERVDDELVTLDGSGSAVLILPNFPVVDVTLITEDPVTAQTALDGPADTSPAWEWSETGIVKRIDGAVWALRARWYEVTYTHGFAEIPADIVGLCARVAARSFENPTGISQEALGGYSYSVASSYSAKGSVGLGLSVSERRLIDAYADR